MKIHLEDRTYEGLLHDFGSLGFRSLLDLEDDEAYALVECYKVEKPDCYASVDMFEFINDDLEWAWLEAARQKMENREYRRDMQNSWDKERYESMR